MARRLIVRSLAVGAVLSGALVLSSATSAQAQVTECGSWNRGGACVEEYLHMNAPTSRGPLVVVVLETPRPATTAQSTQQSSSQASPQAEAQSAAEE
jgi:hypothetical protein